MDGIKYPHVEVQLTGEKEHYLLLMGRCIKAAQRGGVPQEEIDAFNVEATSGDYNHLIQTCTRWWTLE